MLPCLSMPEMRSSDRLRIAALEDEFLRRAESESARIVWDRHQLQLKIEEWQRKAGHPAYRLDGSARTKWSLVGRAHAVENGVFDGFPLFRCSTTIRSRSSGVTGAYHTPSG